jgi:hypothetical protein
MQSPWLISLSGRGPIWHNHGSAVTVAAIA